MLDAGVYELSGTLTIEDRNLTLAAAQTGSVVLTMSAQARVVLVWQSTPGRHVVLMGLNITGGDGGYGDGGGVYIYGNVNMHACAVYNCRAFRGGGVIVRGNSGESYPWAVHLSGCLIFENDAYNGYGYGVLVDSGATTTVIEDSRVYSNKGMRGGAIASGLGGYSILSMSVILTSVDIRDNNQSAAGLVTHYAGAGLCVMLFTAVANISACTPALVPVCYSCVLVCIYPFNFGNPLVGLLGRWMRAADWHPTAAH